VLGQSLSGLPRKCKFNWLSLLTLSAPVGCTKVDALFHILFASLHPWAFFQALVHTSAFCLCVRSEIGLMLFHLCGGSCMRTNHNMLLYCHRGIQLTQTSTFARLQFRFSSILYISMSIHVKFNFEVAAVCLQNTC